jgi:hypothetical protein
VSGLTERGGGWSLPIIPVQSIVHRVLTLKGYGHRNVTSQPTPLPLEGGGDASATVISSTGTTDAELSSAAALPSTNNMSRKCSPKTKYVPHRTSELVVSANSSASGSVEEGDVQYSIL